MTAMPPLGSSFMRDTTAALNLIAATETLWLTARGGSAVRQQLRPAQLEALYESAYLRIFTMWEDFLEQALLRYMVGRTTPSYTPIPVAGSSVFGTIAAARTHLFNGRRYLLWHDGQTAADRCRRYLQHCPYELVLTGSAQQLEDFSAIRHRIAHSSTDAKNRFANSAVRLAGQAHGDSPGRLLRAADISDPLNQRKWVRVITDELRLLALQIAP
jgi:hypothetical protein